MAIPAQNISYNGQGPVAGGSATLAFGGSSVAEVAYVGTATFTLDGSLTAATLNYIDGTNALPFTPSGILATRIGGTAAQTVTVTSVVDAADGGKTATVNFGAAGSNGNTVKIAFMVLK